MKVRSFLLLFNLLIGLSIQAFADTVGAKQIKQLVDQYMAAHNERLLTRYGGNIRTQYTVNSLDSRLTMNRCSEPLEPEIKGKKQIGRVSVQVSCRGDKPWSLYVPVNIQLFRPVVMALAPVPKGEPIEASDLELRDMDIGRLNGSYFTEMEAVIGMEARRPLRPDTPLMSHYVQPPVVIKKGEEVYITARSGTLTVKIPAIALGNGRQGQQISVRNRQSKRVVEAKVTGPGQVAVAM